MQRRAEHTRVRTGGTLLWALFAGCGGTPTAEPPDFLPTPRGIGVGTEATPASSGIESFGPIPVDGAAGAVDPDAEVWIVNLDREDAPAVIVLPKSDGSFAAEVEGNVGDRFRLLSRTGDRHSLPLDLVAVRGLGMTSLSRLQDQGLACLKVSPLPELDLGDDAARRESYTLNNECSGVVRIDLSTLRFAEGALALTSPTSIGVGEEGKLELQLNGTLNEELWDIVLLEVSSGGQSGRYALSVWAR